MILAILAVLFAVAVYIRRPRTPNLSGPWPEHKRRTDWDQLS